MAIQLNDRDYQIFKLLEEHQVLLEKHISWFIAPEAKPVLIRDRLRKLFYLDYLLCQRHDTKLAWWTTPTKPLVYMLAPLARTISGVKQDIETASGPANLYDKDWQRNHLEIANIRMVFLIAQKEGLLKTFDWKTIVPTNDSHPIHEAIISCTWQSVYCNIGLISHPELNSNLADRLSKALEHPGISHTMIISRDQNHQESLQKLLVNLSNKMNVNSILLTTHHDLYKSGLAKVNWQNILGHATVFPNHDSSAIWNPDFGTMKAASA